MDFKKIKKAIAISLLATTSLGALANDNSISIDSFKNSQVNTIQNQKSKLVEELKELSPIELKAFVGLGSKNFEEIFEREPDGINEIAFHLNVMNGGTGGKLTTKEIAAEFVNDYSIDEVEDAYMTIPTEVRMDLNSQLFSQEQSVSQEIINLRNLHEELNSLSPRDMKAFMSSGSYEFYLEKESFPSSLDEVFEYQKTKFNTDDIQIIANKSKEKYSEEIINEIFDVHLPMSLTRGMTGDKNVSVQPSEKVNQTKKSSVKNI
jgi:hypothetical protein